ncbi:hypothetical protein JXD38_05145, partial [candidate division WOR-3 bacterium]|nr:hypothetical protein [candidate division WOR-3 bacterium]
SSLAQQQARDKIRVRLLPLSGPPEMLLATTDGYPNSFPDVPSALDDVLADVRRLAGKHGEAWVEDNLGSWLREATEKGSGDDCTVVLALNTAAVARRREPETEPDNPPGEQPEGKTEGSEHGDAEEREHGPDQPVKD